MNFSENLKLKLQNRARSVLESREENFSREVKIFYDFVKQSSLLNGILIELESVEFNLEEYLESDPSRYRRFICFPDEHILKIAMCNQIMQKFVSGELGCLSMMFINITAERNIDVRCHVIAEQYFLPLYEYFDEKIRDCSTMLYLLDKYRHSREWFHKSRLYKLYNENTKFGEDILTMDLQKYLHDQGIDYPFSTPHSPSGRSDIVGLIDTPDPLVLEIKIFDLNKSYDKAYIRKGLTQAYRYALDYGKHIGYLLIFNTDEKDLVFEKPGEEAVKSISIGDKLIFIICVNIFENSKTASQLKKPLPYVIEDSYLKNLEEEI